MGIRDRGIIKWRAAAFMPEQRSLLKKALLDDKKVKKPILDKLQWEEIEQNILLAMEYADPVVIKVWQDGIFIVHKGMLHRMDDINKVLYLQTEVRQMIKLPFDEIVEALNQNT
ncbi:YolD-like family protein [Neobacillus sp. YIM B06451]|uniref:YolD-like family protein n=1 Tax=Neobacillus sp. YIM B06451 TaxID=3070994 RepID=UPI00292DCE77|nr:YolD-like family protein [Neobacillus sp. YIM B06451]